MREVIAILVTGIMNALMMSGVVLHLGQIILHTTGRLKLTGLNISILYMLAALVVLLLSVLRYCLWRGRKK